MSGDWQPGDLALCVGRDGGTVCLVHGPTPLRIGAIYTVSIVKVVPDIWGRPQLGVGLAELGGMGFNALWFRKINPLTDEELRDAHEETREPESVSA